MPLQGAEQRWAGTPRPGTNKALLSLGRGPHSGEGGKRPRVPTERGPTPPGFTDPCCPPSGWRSRSVAAFRRTPAPPGGGQEQEPSVQHTLHQRQLLSTPRHLPAQGAAQGPQTRSDPRLAVSLPTRVCTTALDHRVSSLWSHPTGLSSHQPPRALSNSPHNSLYVSPLKTPSWIQTPETKHASPARLDRVNTRGICQAKRCQKRK